MITALRDGNKLNMRASVSVNTRGLHPENKLTADRDPAALEFCGVPTTIRLLTSIFLRLGILSILQRILSEGLRGNRALLQLRISDRCESFSAGKKVT